MSRPLLALSAALLAASVLGACGGDDGAADAAADPSADAETVSCAYPDAGPASKPVDKPPSEAPSEGQVGLTIATSAGDLVVTLDSQNAPCTVNSFRSLARQGYFDDTTCHRLTLPESGIAVLQCGDPTAAGTGGPGYSFADELTGTETYPAGTLAMANAGPDTNGSQFFVVYGDTPLPPDYTVFGSLDEASVGAVEEVAAGGTSTGEVDGPPATPVTITGVTE